MKIRKRLSELGIRDSNDAFKELQKSFRDSLFSWDYFVDWHAVKNHADQFNNDLVILNSLLGSSDFDSEFVKLLEQNPRLVNAIPSLLVRTAGVRDHRFSILEDIHSANLDTRQYDLKTPPRTSEECQSILHFVKKTGLKDLFTSGRISDLRDYLIGVEAGLNSNARKNRTGAKMEQVVEVLLQKSLKGTNFEILPKAGNAKIAAKWGFELNLDKASRVFDFAVSDGKKLILIETNFYAGGGSKLKSVAGEFRNLRNRYLTQDFVRFVWVTDGKGWDTSLNPLKEAFDEIDDVWSLDWLAKDFILDVAGD